MELGGRLPIGNGRWDQDRVNLRVRQRQDIRAAHQVEDVRRRAGPTHPLEPLYGRVDRQNVAARRDALGGLRSQQGSNVDDPVARLEPCVVEELVALLAQRRKKVKSL